MPLKETQTLDLDKSYPCPCCHHGSLVPITLTEAWGCDHCEQIFERREEPDTIGKLATPYHRQRAWRWDGKQWVVASKLVRPTVVDLVVAVAFLVCLFWLGLMLPALTGLSLPIGIAALTLLALVVMFWVVLRR